MTPIPEDGYFQPRVKPKHRCPMTKELQFVRKHVIPKLLKHPFALPFKYPVDAIQEGIYPDYFLVISHPMDLYTIKARLDHGWYWNLNHCLSDINLVWRNARSYNPPDHVLHEWAVQLKNFTYSLLKRLKHMQWANEDKRNTTNLRECEQLLETIQQDTALSDPFKIIRVDERMGGRLDAIDLDGIEKNLKAGEYPSADAFAADFRRMISHTYRYADENDPIVEKAKNLSHKFEYLFARRILSEEDDHSNQANIYKDDLDDDLLKTMLRKAKTIEDQISKLIQEEKAESMETGETNIHMSQDNFHSTLNISHDNFDPGLNMLQDNFDARRAIAKDLVVKIAALDSAKLKEVISIVRKDELLHSRIGSASPTSVMSSPGSLSSSPDIHSHLEDQMGQQKEELPEENEEYLTLDFGTMNFNTMLHLQQYVESL